jgi:hypothetical protein
MWNGEKERVRKKWIGVRNEELEQLIIKEGEEGFGKNLFFRALDFSHDNKFLE